MTELSRCVTDYRIYKAKIFFIRPFAENVWQPLFYKNSNVIPSDVFGLKTHPRHGLRGTSAKRKMVRSRQNVKATTEGSRVQGLRYRQKPRQKFNSIVRTNMVGIKAKMSLIRLVGDKFTLVMEETKSRTASPISVTFW